MQADQGIQVNYYLQKSKNNRRISMKVYICEICGHIEFNDIPEECPVCMAEKDKFKQDDSVFDDSRKKSPEAEVKHIPSVAVNKHCGLIPEEGCTDIIVRIGETLHPMQEKHFIQFVDCYQDGNYVARAQFFPEKVFPAACFHVKKDSGRVTVVENCNIHGYWMTEVEL